VRFGVIILPGDWLRDPPPAGWTRARALGQHGRVLLLPAGTPADFVTLPLLGYAPEALGSEPGAHDPLGAGRAEPPPVAVEPFQSRHHRRGAWVSPRVRSRGQARALGLAIYELGAPVATLRRRLQDHEVVYLELSGTVDQEAVLPLVEDRDPDVRLLLVAVSPPGDWSAYVQVGAGLEALPEELPEVERGAELLSRFLEGFGV
jgi:hypothetical protein